MAKINYSFNIQLYNKEGEKEFEYEREGHSFTNSFLGWINTPFKRLFKFLNKDGVSYNLTLPEAGGEYLIDIDGLANEDDDTYGILIGSSDKAFDRYDKWLSSQYKKDVFKHYKTELHVEADNYIELSRKFENISGATKTVKEIGIALRIESTEASYYSLIARDVLVPINVEANAILVVRYKIEIE